MAEFMLLFRGGDPEQAGLSPEELQQYFGRWRAWAEGLRQEGMYLSGRPLDRKVSKVVSAGGLVSDGPFPESKEMVAGYFALEVDDLTQAVEIAKQCPIFELDGKVEVRVLYPDKLKSCNDG